MSSIDFSKKASRHESVQWINDILNDPIFSDITNLKFSDQESLQDFIYSKFPQDFKPPRKSRKSSSKDPMEKANIPYNSSKCDARVWNNSYGSQCNNTKLDGQCFCKTHMKEADKHNGLLRNGLFIPDQPRYTHAYNDPDGELLLWNGVTPPEKPQSQPSEKKQRKCGQCGGFGHNKRTCPQLNDSPLCQPCSPQNTQQELVEDPSNIGAGTGINLPTVQVPIESPNQDPIEDPIEEPNEEPNEESPVETPNDNDNDNGNDNDSDSSDDETDTTGHTDCSFEGIKYTHKNGIVYDDEFDEVGEWDGEIVFSKYGKKNHKAAKLALQQTLCM